MRTLRASSRTVPKCPLLATARRPASASGSTAAAPATSLAWASDTSPASTAAFVAGSPSSASSVASSALA
jgi:hypothetical protein